VSRRLVILIGLLAGQAFGGPPATDDPAALLAKAKQARNAKASTTAITLLEQCLVLAPDDADCLLALASTHAQRGGEQNNESDNKKARRFYERFLTVARAGDARIERVRMILGYDDTSPPIVVSDSPPRPKPGPKPMAGERVVITVGGTHRITVPSFERVDIAQTAIATVELESPGVLLVTGRKVGNTTLTWSTMGHQTWAIPVTVQATAR